MWAAALCLLLFIGAGTYWFGLRRIFTTTPVGRIESLAVLPLDDLSEDATQAFFAAGLTDALTTELSKISSLRVVSRTSAMQFKNASKSASDIARELSVDALVEGSVLRDGNRVRVTAQLIDAASDGHVWAETYDRNLSDLLNLQRELVRAIANRIQVALTPREQGNLTATHPVAPAALEAYFKGRFELERGSIEGFRRALEYFENAAAADTTYAAPYAGMADAYMFLGNYSALPPRDGASQAKKAIDKALSLDESLAEAHASLGDIYHNYEWDQVKAETAYRRAIELNPSSAQARASFAFFLMKMGRFGDAEAQDAQWRTLDPLSLWLTPAYMSYFQGQYADAIDRWRAHVDGEPAFELAHFFLIESYLADKRYEDALRAVDVALKQFPDRTRQLKFRALRGQVFGLAGKHEDAVRVVADLTHERTQAYVRPVQIAQIYAAAGDKAHALEWLATALQERDDWITWSGVDPSFDLLRADAAFQGLLRRIGVPDLRRRSVAGTP
jgi:TolB-like protein